jgi:hypothetical protein
MSDNLSDHDQPSVWIRFWRFFVRFLFVVFLGIALGALIYWTIPALYRQYIQPVQIHGMQIGTLETRLDLLEKYANDQFTSYLSRIQNLETQQDNHKNEISVLESRLAELDAKSATQQAQLNVIETITEQMVILESEVEDLHTADSILETQSQDILTAINTIKEQLSDQGSEIETISALVSSEDARWGIIIQELQILQVMELLNRSRANLSQGKSVLAQADIQAAHSVLSTLQNKSIDGQITEYEPILDHLESAMTKLPDNPVSSADDLEAAWELLRISLPVIETPSGNLSNTPEATLEATPTPTLIPTSTSTNP